MSARRPEPAQLVRAAPVFAALGDETRMRMVARLGADGPMTTAQLGAGVDVTRQAIFKHLHVLADAGLVRATRRGRDSVWELETRGLAEAHRLLRSISEQWDGALERLRAFVEDPDAD